MSEHGTSPVEPPGRSDERARYEQARQHVRALRGFYTHLVVYLGVNALLHLIDLAGSPGVYWAFWPALGWGVGLLMHAAGTFRWLPFLGREWEERKIRKLMEKE
jgi:hypothetical protein